MKECIKVSKLLSRYLDKEASCADNLLIEAHLDKCLSCKKELLELSRIKELVLGKERKTLPQDYLVCRLRQNIADERCIIKQGLSWLSGIGDFSRKIIPVPVAVIVISLVFMILTSKQQLTEYSLEEHVLSGAQTTTETALGVMLGVLN
jgi:predicted anti-sigma-YlaC factor YlaD